MHNGVSGEAVFRHIIRLEKTSSTNDVAKQEARAGAPEGVVVVADHQTAGRGRRGRSWVTPPGTALMFSVLLRPPIEPRQAPLLVFLAAAAVREVVADGIGDLVEANGAALDEFSDRVLIKWPNDVVVDGRKVCGVLVELSADAGRVQWCVVGVGVNVNQLPDDFPPELSGQATSMRAVTGRSWDREALLDHILAGMARRYRHVLKHGFDDLLAEVRRYSATIGKHVRVFEADGSHWDGLAVDVQDDGALLVQAMPGVGMGRKADPRSGLTGGHGAGEGVEGLIPVYAADVSVRSER